MCTVYIVLSVCEGALCMICAWAMHVCVWCVCIVCVCVVCIVCVCVVCFIVCVCVVCACVCGLHVVYDLHVVCTCVCVCVCVFVGGMGVCEHSVQGWWGIY